MNDLLKVWHFQAGCKSVLQSIPQPLGMAPLDHCRSEFLSSLGVATDSVPTAPQAIGPSVCVQSTDNFPVGFLEFRRARRSRLFFHFRLPVCLSVCVSVCLSCLATLTTFAHNGSDIDFSRMRGRPC